VQNGYSRQCPNCEVIIFFEEDSSNKNVQLAMKEAKKVRRALREDVVKPASASDESLAEGGRQYRPVSRSGDSGRRAWPGRSEQTEEN
jgi:hypothetical protein